MKKRQLIIFAFGLAVLVALVGFSSLKRTLELDFSASTQAHSDARAAFLRNLPQSSCLRAADIAQVAEARGWQTKMSSEHGFCVKPGTLVSWLRVQVEPGLPFSTDDESAEIFGFGSDGCAVPWEYGSGPGSNCPDD